MYSKFSDCIFKVALVTSTIILTMDGAYCQTKSKKEIYSQAISFQSAEKLDEYTVSGLWFPEGMAPFSGLSGPAIFVFRNIKSGKQHFVAVNAVSLVDKDFWDKHQMPNAEQFEPEELVEKLTGFGTISISLSQNSRAKISDCKLLFGAFSPREGSDRCLQLGDAVVDLQDVDFDGKKELVFKHAGLGQRGGAAYEIMRMFEDDGVVEQRETKEPFNEIDWRTLFNITKKQIVIQGSNGACADEETTYSSRGEMIRYRALRPTQSDDCFLEDYAISNESNGISRRLKLTSRQKN